MAVNKNISVLYKENETAFLKRLKSASKLEEEKIHKLRVSIKKLRSLLSFLEYISKGKYNKKQFSKLLSPVFKRAGKIRTAGLNLKMLQPFRSAGVLGFKKYLKAEQKINEKKLKRCINDFDKNKFKALSKTAEKEFKKSGKVSTIKASKKFITNVFSDITSEMPGLYDDLQFHKVRKDLKSIKTIEELIGEINPRTTIFKELEKVKKVEQKIGKWHDRAILVDEIGKYIAKQRANKKVPIKQTKELQKLALLLTDFKTANEKDKKSIAKQLEQELI